MRQKLFRILRSIAAAIAGYLVIVAGTTLAFEYMLGGIGYYKSSPAVLVIASVAALVSGLAGGYVAAWVGGRPYLGNAATVLVPLVLDTTYVITSGISHDPVWYDLFGAGTLMVAAILGGFLKERVSKRPLVFTPT
jgi:hypothetical protein